MSRTSPPYLRVERALALVPDGEEFLPLAEAVIASSARDRDNAWARSAAYATLGKRLLDADRLADALPDVLARAQERLAGLYARVLEAVRLQQSGDVAGAAVALVRAGEVEEGDGRLAKAERIYAFALELSRDLRDRGPEVLALRRLGRAARAAGRLDDAYRWRTTRWTPRARPSPARGWETSATTGESARRRGGGTSAGWRSRAGSTIRPWSGRSTPTFR